ncbi:uncharacterized protein ACRADG_013036 [Cochliomyia hominivorax]
MDLFTIATDRLAPVFSQTSCDKEELIGYREHKKISFNNKFLIFQIQFTIVLVLICCNEILADTKILRDFSVSLKNALHKSTISSDHEENLLSEGLIVQKYAIPNDPGHVFKVIVEYVAGKDGYKPKVMWIKEEYVEILRLAPNTLKSVTG